MQQDKKQLITYCVIGVLVIVVAVMGYFLYKGQDNKLPTQFTPKTLATETVEQKDRTVIQYVPKASASDADVELNKAQPQVGVKVNGQDYKFDLVQGETKKFDKGKVVMDQSSTLKLDIKVPEQTNRVKLGVYGEAGGDKGEAGVKASYQTKKYDLDVKYNTHKQAKVEVTYWF